MGGLLDSVAAVDVMGALHKCLWLNKFRYHIQISRLYFKFKQNVCFYLFFSFDCGLNSLYTVGLSNKIVNYYYH